MAGIFEVDKLYSSLCKLRFHQSQVSEWLFMEVDLVSVIVFSETISAKNGIMPLFNIAFGIFTEELKQDLGPTCISWLMCERLSN